VHWLLAIGYCLLSIAYCLLYIGYWLLSIAYWVLSIGYWLLYVVYLLSLFVYWRRLAVFSSLPWGFTTHLFKLWCLGSTQPIKQAALADLCLPLADPNTKYYGEAARTRCRDTARCPVARTAAHCALL
jgi:hypothetical protein